MITEKLENVVLSQNAIRIVPKKGAYSGYLYAYLSTYLGQTLVKKDKFGVTVKHIQPHHVSSVIIPDIDQNIQKKPTRIPGSAQTVGFYHCTSCGQFHFRQSYSV